MPYSPGTCRGCGVDVDGTRCDACKAQRREQEATRRAELRAAGRCLVCAGPVAKSKLVGTGNQTHTRVRTPAVYCTAHLEYYAARARG